MRGTSMKKLANIILTSAMALTIMSAAVLAFSHKKAPEVANAADSITPPDLLSTFSTGSCQIWDTSGDPDAGKSSDPSVYSYALNSSTPGYSSYGSSVYDINTGKDGYSQTYIKVTSKSSTSRFQAQYTPFRIAFTLAAYRKYTYQLNFEIYARRFVNNSSNAGADYSTEFFHYGETELTPTSWFYHQGDFTESTGRGYSHVRAAGEKNDSTGGVTKLDSVTVNLENNDSLQKIVYVYFGMFCYNESSGSNGTFEGKVTLKSATVEYSNALATVNNKNYYDVPSAMAAYNAQASSSMTLLTSLNFSSSNYQFNSANGTVNFGGYTADLGGAFFYVNANTTFEGPTNSKITSSCAYATIAVTTAATLTLDGSLYVINTNNTTETSRAILLSDANSKLFVGPNNFIVSNYYGVQIDNGYLYLRGRIQSNNSKYSINVGSSDAANKYIYLYGSMVQAEKINTANLSKTYIYASYNSTDYASSFSVSITSSTVSVGNIIVRSVTDSNYNKFSINATGYVLSRSGSNLVVAYRSYNVTYSLTNMTQTGGANTASRAANLSFTLALASGGNYLMPETITITVSGSTLTVDTQYTYDKTTGAVVVYKENLTGNVVVVAKAIVVFTMRFFDPEGNVIHDPMEVAQSTQYQLPFPSIIPAYHSSVYWYLNPELTGSSYYYGTNLFASESVDYYAKITQTNADVVDEFVGVKLHFDVDVISTDDERDTGACRGESGYYAIAKEAYLELSSQQKSLFRSNNSYAAARLRLSAWATANGEIFNPSSGTFTQQSANAIMTINNSNNNLIVIISVIICVSAASLTILMFIKKRRQK